MSSQRSLHSIGCWPAVRLEIPDLHSHFLSSRTFSWDREGLSLMFSVLLHLSLLTPWPSRWHLPCAGLCPKVATLNSSSLHLCRLLITL